LKGMQKFLTTIRVDLPEYIGETHKTPIADIKPEQFDFITYINAAISAGLITIPSVYVYDAGEGFWVTASNTGIVANTSSQGVYDIEIPSGVYLFSFYKQFSNASEYTIGGDAIINIDWSTTAFNTSFVNAKLPVFSFIPSNDQQYDYHDLINITVRHNTPVAGTTSTTLSGINGGGVPMRVQAQVM